MQLHVKSSNPVVSKLGTVIDTTQYILNVHFQAATSNKSAKNTFVHCSVRQVKIVVLLQSILLHLV